MAACLAVEERALVLAPAQVGSSTCRLLRQAGIHSRRTADVRRLGRWLSEGAGLLVVIEQALPRNQRSPLHRYLEQQPGWSDLPVVLLTSHAEADTSAVPGNLLPLAPPYPDEQLLSLALWALRARRRQYQARDLCEQLEALAQQQQADDQALQQTRKMEAIGQLAGGVAHDFNNLLTSIGGSLELIDKRLRQGRSEGLEPPLRLGQQAVARAALLTHRLLAFSARQSLQCQAIDLRPLLAPDALAAKLCTGIELQVRLATQLWQASADGEQLQAALDNLLLNACEAMPSGGVLNVEADNVQVTNGQFANVGLAHGDYLCLSIRDSGQGMSQATLEHAIEPFFTTKPTGQGVGLGLSMVYGFCRQSRGYLALDSQIGKGTRVRLYLPRHTDSPPPLKAAAVKAAGDCQDILLVEDDPDVRELVERTLLEEGYPCRAAQNASEALRWLHSPQPFGLLISDVGLPGMNGRQLAEIARRLRPGLPVLFITGFAQTAMARDAFLATGMQLLRKPFALEQLRNQVARMLVAP